MCSNISIIVSGTNTGVTENGFGYSAISVHVPTIPSISVSATSPDPVSINLCSLELEGFKTEYDEEGEPVGQSVSQTFYAGLTMNVSYGSSPTLGVFGISVSLEVC